MDSTCAEGSFYLTFTNASDSSNAQLDYDNLPPVFSADGTSVSRVGFEDAENAELCDDPCQPTSGGRTCRALSCYEVSRQGRGLAQGALRMYAAEHQRGRLRASLVRSVFECILDGCR